MYLAVDIGTSSMKAGVLDSRGELLGYSRSFFSVKPGTSFTASIWLNAFSSLMKDLQGLPVDALSISSNGPTLIPVDSRGEPVDAALFWQDGNSVPLKSLSYYLPKIKWFQKNRPDLYGRTSLFLSPAEFLVFKLTSAAWMSTSDSRFSPYLWTEEQVARCGLDWEKLPPIGRVGSPAGKVTDESASRFLLKSGIPCFLMGSDFQASLLGTSAVSPGVVCDRAGTSEGLNFCTDHLPRSKELRNLPHIIPGLWNSSAILSSTGALFEWLRDLTGQGQRDYKDMLEDIAKEECSLDDLYFFPTLKHGGLWEFSGGMLMGLDPFHGRESLGKAMLESVGFSVRRGLDLLEHKLGQIEKIVVCGGQAKNPVWNQMKADYTGRTLLVPRVVDAELLGCACASACGLGLYGSLSQASRSLFKVDGIVTPSENTREWVQGRYGLYKKISRRVKSFYRKKLRIELDK